MKWRARAGMIVVVLVVLGVSAQPTSRWIVSKSLARTLAGQVRINGSLFWSAPDETLHVRNVSLDSAAWGRVQIDRLQARIDPYEFLQRNLVINSATLQGVVLHRERDTSLVSRKARETGIHRSSAAPAFELHAWLESIRRESEDRTLEITDQCERIGEHLVSRFDTIERRAHSISQLDQNPLRNRVQIEELRRDCLGLRQALAEERVRLREIDREIRRASQRMLEEWHVTLGDAIAASLPDRRPAIERTILDHVEVHLRSRQTILEVLMATAFPSPAASERSLGVDVPLPGIENRFTLVRSANIQGQIESGSQVPIEFACAVTGWTDVTEPDANFSRGQPALRWQFEVPDATGVRSLQAEVLHETSSSGAAAQTTIDLFDATRPVIREHTRLVLDRVSGETRGTVQLPMTASIATQSTDAANPDWNGCLLDAMSDPPLMIEAQVQTICDWKDREWCRSLGAECRIADESWTSLEQRWDSARRHYVERGTTAAMPQAKPVIEQAVDEGRMAWLEGASRQNELLGRIDSGLHALLNSLEPDDVSYDRMAKKDRSESRPN